MITNSSSAGYLADALGADSNNIHHITFLKEIFPTEPKPKPPAQQLNTHNPTPIHLVSHNKSCWKKHCQFAVV